ncbi:hypothetical protein ILT44_25385 [Microvirga sp. BT689]|uniref:hypothetical protein n=1 Tax=Microvirga arvi TaxID=2778731 RepID=UPI001950EBFD|nr:hypothetical protein [Microvirga arvi]MBM6583538.1 hypothetical protein [Microvirga arvi]
MTRRLNLSPAKLRTLELLSEAPAYRKRRTPRQADYTWVHENAKARSITQTLHQLFLDGLATVANDNRNQAVITEKGRETVRMRRQRSVGTF